VRLIGADGQQLGIVPIRDAMQKAEELELDLVEVAPDAKPPVCKIEDFAKIVYQKKKQMREAKKRQRTIEIKEIKVRPNCDPHDFGIKMNRAAEFLDKGAKVKLTMMFKGREIATARERSEVLRDKVLEALKAFGEMESMSRVNPRNATMIITPLKKAVAKTDQPRQKPFPDRPSVMPASAARDADDDDDDDLDDDIEDDDDDDNDENTEETAKN
jgi:translation initiation factor IF-3